MALKDFLFTSESVSEGHPDKLCDQISDAVLDAMLAQDPNSRVACEVMATSHLVIISGEITSQAHVDVIKTAKNVIKNVGYTSDELFFNADSCKFMISINQQSSDI